MQRLLLIVAEQQFDTGDRNKGEGTAPPAESTGEERVRRSPVRETVELVVIAVFIALVLRVFVVQAFRIPTASMEDTLLVGDFILVEKITYGPRVNVGIAAGRLPGLRKPRTGDVAVFKYPIDPSVDFVKRLIAGPGQTVQIVDRKVYVDGELFPDPPGSKHIEPEILPGSRSNRDNYGPITVPDGQYFFMGDNRENSRDSREWGYVPVENIKGRAFMIYLSWEPDPTIPWFNLIRKIRWSHLFRLVR